MQPDFESINRLINDRMDRFERWEVVEHGHIKESQKGFEAVVLSKFSEMHQEIRGMRQDIGNFKDFKIRVIAYGGVIGAVGSFVFQYFLKKM